MQLPFRGVNKVACQGHWRLLLINLFYGKKKPAIAAGFLSAADSQ